MVLSANKDKSVITEQTTPIKVRKKKVISFNNKSLEDWLNTTSKDSSTLKSLREVIEENEIKMRGGRIE